MTEGEHDALINMFDLLFMFNSPLLLQFDARLDEIYP